MPDVSPPELLESPANVNAKLDLANRLLLSREEEVFKLQQKLTELRAQLSAEEQQWSRKRKQEELELDLKREALLEAQVRQSEEQGLLIRRQQTALEEAAAMREEARQALQAVVEREAEMSTLNQDRLEIGQLRLALEQRRAEVESLWSQAQAKFDTASTQHDQAAKILQECELRTQAMHEEWNRLTAWERDLKLGQKNYEILKQTVDQKIGALTQEGRDGQGRTEVQSERSAEAAGGSEAPGVPELQAGQSDQGDRGS